MDVATSGGRTGWLYRDWCGVDWAGAYSWFVKDDAVSYVAKLSIVDVCTRLTDDLRRTFPREEEREAVGRTGVRVLVPGADGAGVATLLLARLARSWRRFVYMHSARRRRAHTPIAPAATATEPSLIRLSLFWFMPCESAGPPTAPVPTYVGRGGEVGDAADTDVDSVLLLSVDEEAKVVVAPVVVAVVVEDEEEEEDAELVVEE